MWGTIEEIQVQVLENCANTKRTEMEKLSTLLMFDEDPEKLNITVGRENHGKNRV